MTPSSLDALFADAREGLAPDDATLARGRLRLLAAVAAPVAFTTVSEAAAGPTAGTGTVVAKAALVAIGLAGATAVAALAVRDDERPPPRAPAAPARVAVPAPPVVVPLPRPDDTPAPAPHAEPPADVPPPRRHREARPTPPAVTRATVDDELARELALLRDARAALRGGQADHALASIDEHDRLFPDGQLGEESAALRVEALCTLDRDEAAPAYAAFVIASPSSIHRPRVDRACAHLEDPDAP